MKNWTLDDFHVGMYLIPEDVSVYGNPEQALTSLCRTVFLPVGTHFGLLSLRFGNVDAQGPASGVVAIMNAGNLRKAKREEVRFLLLYAEQCQFAIPPEDEPIDN